MDRNSVSAARIAVMIITMMVFSFVNASAVFSEPITVIVDGRTLHPDVPPTFIQERTMVPFRSIFEALGAVVQWDQSTRTVTSTKDATVIQFKIGSRIADINGVQMPIEVPGTIIGGRTMVPAPFIADSLGVDVRWDEETRTVVVNNSAKTDNLTVENKSDSITVDPPKIPVGTVHNSHLEREIVEAYLFAYSLEERLWDQADSFRTKEEVFQFMQQGFSDVFAWNLADYYWTDPDGLMGVGAYLIVPEHTIHVLEIEMEIKEASLWHETDAWERDHWRKDAYKIVTLQLEDGVWKVQDERSVGTPPT